MSDSDTTRSPCFTNIHQCLEGIPLSRFEFIRKGVEMEEALRCLTTREREVFALLGEGLSNRHISRWLEITERTVKAHVTQIFNKLDMRSRLEAAIAVNAYRWSVEFAKAFDFDGRPSRAAQSRSVVFRCRCAETARESDGGLVQDTSALAAVPGAGSAAEPMRGH